MEDHTGVWAYGIIEPGWYLAKGIWDPAYARDLKGMGYHIERASGREKPTWIPETAALPVTK